MLLQIYYKVLSIDAFFSDRDKQKQLPSALATFSLKS